MLRIISLAFTMLIIVGASPVQPVQPVQPRSSVVPSTPPPPGGTPPPPSIAVNGASSGTTVTAGASMSVAVANGPGNATDWMGVCNAGVPVSSTQCNGAGYSWDYLNCTQTAPTTGVTSATCSLPAPSAAGNYNAVFFSNNTFSVLASAPFGVTVPVSGGGGGSGGPAVVQTGSATTTLRGTGSSCTFPIPSGQAIASGDTVIGFIHSDNAADTVAQYPTSVTDNVGNTYTLSAGMQWLPYNEDIGMWYLTNIQGNPTSFTFTFPPGIPDYYCNPGFVEYSGVNSINAIVGPVDNMTTPDPSITISPTATSTIWAFAAPNPISSCSNSGQQGSIENSGYSILVDDCLKDGLAVWGSNSQVSAGPLTLTWNNHDYWNAPYCADNPNKIGPPGTGCSTLMMAAAIN